MGACATSSTASSTASSPGQGRHVFEPGRCATRAAVRPVHRASRPACWMQPATPGWAQRADGPASSTLPRDAACAAAKACARLPHHRPAGASSGPDAVFRPSRCAGCSAFPAGSVTDHIPPRCKDGGSTCDRLPPIDHDLHTDDLVGTSPGFQAASLLIARRTASDGAAARRDRRRQELFARALHNVSPRAAAAVRGDQLRGAAQRSSSREAVRRREGRLHRRAAVARRPLPSAPPAARCSSTRSARAVGLGAVQAAARTAGRRGRAHRRHAHAQGRRARGRGDLRRSGAGRCRSGVSARTCSTASTSTR